MCNQIARKNGQQDLHDTNAIGTVAGMIEVQQLIAASNDPHIVTIYAAVFKFWSIEVCVNSKCLSAIQERCNSPCFYSLTRWPWKGATSSSVPGTIHAHLKNHTGKKWLGGRAFSCRLDAIWCIFAQGFEVVYRVYRLVHGNEWISEDCPMPDGSAWCVRGYWTTTERNDSIVISRVKVTSCFVHAFWFSMMEKWKVIF